MSSKRPTSFTVLHPSEKAATTRSSAEPVTVLDFPEASTWLLATQHESGPLEQMGHMSHDRRLDTRLDTPMENSSTTTDPFAYAEPRMPSQSSAPQFQPVSLTPTRTMSRATTTVRSVTMPIDYSKRTSILRPRSSRKQMSDIRPLSSPVDPSSLVGVAYGDTSERPKPTLGDRPLQPHSIENGIAIHARTSTAIPEVPKSNRRSLYLRNPVHLLLRRRSQVPAAALTESYNAKSLTVAPMALPDDFDPRIRGSVIHDFNAPRPTSTYRASQLYASRDDRTAETPDETRQAAPGKTPSRPTSQSDKRASTFRILPEPATPKRPVIPPVPVDSSAESKEGTTEEKAPDLDFQQFRRSIGEWQARMKERSSIVFEENKDQPRASRLVPNPMNSQRLSPTIESLPDQGAAHALLALESADDPKLPKHNKSNASRFSFQLAAHDSAAEQKLVDERVKVDGPRSGVNPAFQEDDEEDFFDEDAMDDEDELELRANDLSSLGGAYDVPTMPMSASALPVSKPFDHTDHASAQYLPPLRFPSEGQHSSLAELDEGKPSSASTIEEEDMESSALTGKRSDSHQGPLTTNAGYDPSIENDLGFSRASHEFDDEAYFQNGAGNKNVPDTTSRPPVAELYGGPGSPKAVRSSKDPQATSSPGRIESAMNTAKIGGNYAEELPRNASVATLTSGMSQASSNTGLWAYDKQYDSEPIVRASFGQHRPKDSYSGFDFGFNDGAAHTGSTNTPISATYPGNHLYTQSGTAPGDDAEEDDADYDAMFDELENDEAIISEANAEALANDDEGFYGREFGFYARARTGSGELEIVNGGYFGARGEPQIERKYSVKEPNLTPITERSEMSTRNSFIGGPFSPSTHSPAFAAQLLRMSPLALAQMQEDDMSLDNMLRLRGLALGGHDAGRNGSVSSFGSAGDAVSARPLSHRASLATMGVGAQFTSKASISPADRSSMRASKSQSELKVQPATRPITAADSPLSPSGIKAGGWSLFPTTADLAAGRSGRAPSEPRSPTSPATSEGGRRKSGHVRQGSDSVTYTKERDEAGNERWVLQRTRTNEYGVSEVVGREIVQGGRI